MKIDKRRKRATLLHGFQLMAKDENLNANIYVFAHSILISCYFLFVFYFIALIPLIYNLFVRMNF